MNLITKKNQPPGTPIYTGIHQVETEITHIVYNQKDLKKVTELSLVPEYNNWYMIKGLKDMTKIKTLCEDFGVDPLVIEDIFNVTQRNKIEYLDQYIFAVFNYSYLKNGKIDRDYLSMLVFKDKVLTFHEHNTNLFDEVYLRLQNNLGFIRKSKVDYLFYALLDTILDNDIFVQKELSIQTIRLEEDIIRLESTDQTVLYNLRKELLFLKKSIDPIYDSFVNHEYKKTSLISSDIYKYFDDITDHTRRIYEDINAQRELLRNLLDVFMNNVSNKMNAVMKTLTIFSAIFIPLSFLAGVFGMNFTNFSILSNPNGLIFFIALCVTIIVSMIVFFKLRKWF
ncbi:MAG: hypothetical protein KKE16_04170 [Firmicutes bacterium]|nr:hypothetical protein [Bacillota bacterium]